jgi:glycine cleavage system aminomethyltransferase T
VGKLGDGDCGQASVAHVQSIVLREDRGGLPAYRVLMGRDYAESVWEAFLHAGEEFGIGAVGARAVEELSR